jgi:hypothetical protein
VVATASPKLMSVLQLHRPRSLGKLWRSHFETLPRGAGYFPIVAADGAHINSSVTAADTATNTDTGTADPSTVAFIDLELTPPFHFFHSPAPSGDGGGDGDGDSTAFDTQNLLTDAFAYRTELLAGTELFPTETFPAASAQACYRLLNERWDKCPGLTIDIYGPHVIICVFSKHWLSSIDQIAQQLREFNNNLESIRFVDNTVQQRNLKYKCSQIWGGNKSTDCEVIEVRSIYYIVFYCCIISA